MIKQSKNFWCHPNLSGPLDFYKRYLLYIEKESEILYASTYLFVDNILDKQCSRPADVYNDGYKPGQYL
jgi:hypothetical protein